MLERYQLGECDVVYDELLRDPANADAEEVAHEMIRRVRVNLETLVERWRERGFELNELIGRRGGADLKSVEAEIGKLPTALRAFYLQVGWVNFVEEPPDGEWPDVEKLDPIQVFAIDDAIQDWESEQLLICHDLLHKFDISGVGPLYVELPFAEAEFDAVISFEGDALRDGKRPLRFVPYLRTTILERGGIGPGGGNEAIRRNLRHELVEGLLPF